MLYLIMLVYTFIVHGRKYVPEHRHVWSKWRKHSIMKVKKHNLGDLDFHIIERVDVRTCTVCEHEDRRNVKLFEAQGSAGENLRDERFKEERELLKLEQQDTQRTGIGLSQQVAARRYVEVVTAVKDIGFDVSDVDIAHATLLSLITTGSQR